MVAVVATEGDWAIVALIAARVAAGVFGVLLALIHTGDTLVRAGEMLNY